MNPRTVLTLGTILTFARSANATLVHMDFGGGADEVTVIEGSTVSIDIWIDLIGNPPGFPVLVDALEAEFNADTSLSITGNSTSLPGWTASVVPGILTPGLSRISANASSPTDRFEGAGSYHVSTMEVLTSTPGSYAVTFLTPTVPPQNPIAQTITYYTGNFDVEMEYDNASAPFFDDYYYFGLGSPFVGATKWYSGQPAQPLTIHVVPIPEPTALILLSIGAFAALRRRD